MKTVKKRFAVGIQPLLSIGAIFLTWLGPAYGGEWKALLPGLTGEHHGLVGNTIEIRIKNLEFTNTGTADAGNNHILILPVGMEVKWVNVDPLVTVNGEQGLMPHGIKISDPAEKVLAASPILTREQPSFSYTFSKEGAYSYGCFIHPFMTGKIVVVNLPGINLAAKREGEPR